MLFAGRPVDIKQTPLPSAQWLARSFREAAAGPSSLGCSGRAAGGGSGRAVGGAAPGIVWCRISGCSTER